MRESLRVYLRCLRVRCCPPRVCEEFRFGILRGSGFGLLESVNTFRNSLELRFPSALQRSVDISHRSLLEVHALEVKISTIHFLFRRSAEPLQLSLDLLQTSRSGSQTADRHASLRDVMAATLTLA